MAIEYLKEQNLEKAIKGYENALQFFTKDTSATRFAEIQVSIGVAYCHLAEIRDPETNLQTAIKAYEEALTVYTKQAFPELHKLVITNLENTKTRFKT